ncbi:hypothetical protein ADL03_42325 [Nocardia sp. NRRL S-836]|nr:hypothetical protein ADL03_42325 [Nocardia sp. NRRL S-836]
MQSLDGMEFAGSSRDETVAHLLERTQANTWKRVHPGLAEWTIQALDHYLAALRDHRERAGIPALIPVKAEWVISKEQRPRDGRGADLYEWTNWGRRYRSADGSLRELWLMHLNDLKERSAAELTAAAHVLAHGTPVGPAAPADHTTPMRVRLMAFCGGSGEAEPRGEWETSTTHAEFGDRVVRRAMKVMDANDRIAGGDCAECKITNSCTALPRFPVLPDLRTRQRGRRTVSVTDLRAYDECPARYHLERQHHLADKEKSEPAPVVLGREVDDWLNKRHEASAARCRPDEMTDLSFPALPPEDASRAARMLMRHTAFCPLSDRTQAPPRVQPSVAAYDDDLRVVLIATPDLMFHRDGTWIWRETKTSSKPPWRGGSLLGQFPQLAMGVLLLTAKGLFKTSRVELEHLRADGGSLEVVDPNQPEVLAEAREVIGALMRPLLDDDEFVATPSTGCGDCRVLAWCAPGRTHLAESAHEKGGR